MRVRDLLKPKTEEEVHRAIQNSSPAQRKQAIQQSVMNNDVKTLEMLKAAGFELNHDLIESLAWRPARDGHFEMIKYLYEEGINLNTIEDAVFRWAARRGHLKIVRFMVEEVGVDLNARENWALENSIQYRRFDVARYLIDAGADNVIWLPMLEKVFIQELADIHQNQKKLKSRGNKLSLWFAPNTPRMGVESYIELNNVPGGIEVRVLVRQSK